jgi:hypothetical protein
MWAIAFLILVIAGYITHIVSCLVNASYVLLLVGVIVFPLGIIHGVGRWSNAWP